MKPQWGSNREPNADPAVEAALRDLMGAVEDLRTARIRMENFDMQAFLDEPTEVTDDFMWMLAQRPEASAELVAYAALVRDRGYRWSDIEKLAWPLPFEVHDLKTSDRFIWKWTAESPATHPDPRRDAPAGPNVVGPSDWPDDFEEYPDSGLK